MSDDAEAGGCCPDLMGGAKTRPQTSRWIKVGKRRKGGDDMHESIWTEKVSGERGRNEVEV